MKERLKALVGERGRLAVRRLGRLRWITKSRVAARDGLTPRTGLRRWLRYVVLDPEVDTFTYGVANTGELLDVLAALTRRPRPELAGYLAETEDDAELVHELRRRTRRRFDTKTGPRLSAHQLSYWIVTRALKPELAVETGILNGLGALVLLRAMERNAQEGRPGRVLSFDIMPGAGWMVADRLRPGWEPVYESTTTALEPALEGRRVGLFIHDSDPAPAHQRFEFTTALRHAAPEVVLIAVDDWDPTLRDVAAESGLEYRQFHEVPDDHFYRGARIGIAARTASTTAST